MSASTQNIDFSQVKDGGAFNRKRIPAGDYLATITKVEDAKAKDETFQYLFTIKIDKLPSSVHPYYCKLVENQLWKLRNLFIAGGIAVPKKRMKIDPNKLINKKIGVTIEDDEYEGKEQSTISGIFPAAELGDTPDIDEDTESEEEEPEDEPLEDEEEAEEAPADEPDEDDEEEAEAETMTDPYATLDRAALKAELKKRDATFQAKKSQTDDDLRALLNAPSEDDEEDEPELEEAPAPAKKAAAAKPRTSKAKAKPAAEVTDEELEELDIDDL